MTTLKCIIHAVDSVEMSCLQALTAHLRQFICEHVHLSSTNTVRFVSFIFSKFPSYKRISELCHDFKFNSKNTKQGLNRLNTRLIWHSTYQNKRTWIFRYKLGDFHKSKKKWPLALKPSEITIAFRARAYTNVNRYELTFAAIVNIYII